MYSAALKLASWIVERPPYAQPLTHLKLQKLAFYSYGVSLAFDFGADIGEIAFDAWKHGPVSVEIYDEYKRFKAEPLPSVGQVRQTSYSNKKLEALLHDVLRVYGVLDAWSLREQSHLEKPWIVASRKGDGTSIERKLIADHFAAKYCSAPVHYPEYVSNVASFRLDGIPVAGFDSFQALANAVGAAYDG